MRRTQRTQRVPTHRAETVFGISRSKKLLGTQGIVMAISADGTHPEPLRLLTGTRELTLRFVLRVLRALRILKALHLFRQLWKPDFAPARQNTITNLICNGQ